jgi:hypothetical protein
MRRTFVIDLVAFFVGLLGLVGVGALHVTGAASFAAALLIGAIAAAPAREVRAVAVWLSLLVGLLAAYPVSMAIGTIDYLGDEWQVALGLVLALATIGYFGFLGFAHLATRRLRRGLAA